MTTTLATFGLMMTTARADDRAPSISGADSMVSQSIKQPKWLNREVERIVRLRSILDTYQPHRRTKRAPPAGVCRGNMDALAQSLNHDTKWLRALLESDDDAEQILGMVLSALNPSYGRMLAPMIAARVTLKVNQMVDECADRRRKRDPTSPPVDDDQCRDQLSGGPAPNIVKYGCRTLEHIGTTSERISLVDIGINGYFARGCVAFFLGGDLSHPAVRRFINFDIGLAPVGGLVREHLVRAGQAAIKAAIVDLEHDKKPKLDDRSERCLLGTIVDEMLTDVEKPPQRPHIDEKLINRLEALTRDRQPHVMDCARTALRRIKTEWHGGAAGKKMKHPPHRPVTLPSFYGPFCHSK